MRKLVIYQILTAIRFANFLAFMETRVLVGRFPRTILHNHLSSSQIAHSANPSNYYLRLLCDCTLFLSREPPLSNPISSPFLSLSIPWTAIKSTLTKSSQTRAMMTLRPPSLFPLPNVHASRPAPLAIPPSQPPPSLLPALFHNPFHLHFPPLKLPLPSARKPPKAPFAPSMRIVLIIIALANIQIQLHESLPGLIIRLWARVKGFLASVLQEGEEALLYQPMSQE